MQRQNISLDSIWIADSTNQGASGLLNEGLQGDDTSWFDHSRDLLLMTNHFRDQMPRPIIGIAHSMGCVQLIHLSIVHPRLLSTLVLFEPVLLEERSGKGGPNPALLSTIRRDIWDSRDRAENSLRKTFSSWDSRVVEKYLKFGLRPVPTPIYDPDSDSTVSSNAVTLTTSKHQEAWSYARANFEPETAKLDRLLLPDNDPIIENPYLTTRPECLIAMRNLPQLRPSVLYVFGRKSALSPPRAQDRRLQLTGTGVGGSGGVAAAKVEKHVLENAGHLVILEQPEKCAQVAIDWIKRWQEKWLADEKFFAEFKDKKSDESMMRVSEAWVKAMKLPSNALRTMAGKL